MRATVTTIMAMAMMASPAEAQQRERFDTAVKAVQERIAAIDALGIVPARAIVAVDADGQQLVDVRGLVSVEGDRAVDADTPFYIASMTKPFVGLMAQRLDMNGTMPLDTTLGAIFPKMKVEGVDFDTLTLRKALSHQLGFRAPILNIRTAFTDRVQVDDYAAIVSASGEFNGEAFRYDNLGYLLYAAALERHTGRAWRAWIDDMVFDPLGMSHSSARTSDAHYVAKLHFTMPEDGTFRLYDPKVDEVMHAAGGLNVSANDMARWLAANAGGESGIPADAFAAAQTIQVPLDTSDGPIKCTGYTLGWRRCEAFGLSFIEHGGGYTGMRAQMVVLPGEGVGFASLFNSDAMTGGLSGNLMKTFIVAYAGQSEMLPAPEAFAAKYAKDVAELRDARGKWMAETRAMEGWGGWDWTPTREELDEIAGTYRSDAYGLLDLSVRDSMMVGTLNGMGMTLEPATPGLFGATLNTDYELEELRVDDGTIEFLGQRFVRR